MNYRRLGDSGIQISEISLGGWLTFGNALEKEKAQAVMDKAFDVGINFYDTANVYAQGKGEEAWSELLAGRRRSSYVLATKVFFPMGQGPNDRGLSRKHIMEQCHASLKRLRTDYIDIYQCHRFDPNVTQEETIRAMDDLIHQGKIIYWGFSEWQADQIESALKICGKGGYYAPKSSQPQYSLIHRNIEQAVMPVCSAAGIGQIVWSPLGQGVLTGKYKPNQPLPGDSRAKDDRQNSFMKDLITNHALLTKVQKLIPIAQEQGCTLAQLALAWILRRPEITCCIIGATKPQQVEENAEASGITLEPETISRVEEILA